MEMKSPHTIWASVAVVFMLVASATLLVILKKDVSIILALAGLVAVPVLGAFGVAVYHKLDQVKEVSNGNQTRILEMLAQSMNQPPTATHPEEDKKKEGQ